MQVHIVMEMQTVEGSTTIVQKERLSRYVTRRLVMKILHAEVFVILRVNQSIVVRMEKLYQNIF